MGRVPACAGLTVTPTVSALTVSAAEMAMMVRFNEDPNMFMVPFHGGPLSAAPPELYSRTVPSAGNCPFLDQRRGMSPAIAPSFGGARQS